MAKATRIIPEYSPGRLFTRPIPSTAHRTVAFNIAATTPVLRCSRRYLRQIGHFFAGLALGLIFAGVLLVFCTGH
jgi:hypothetical protein